MRRALAISLTHGLAACGDGAVPVDAPAPGWTEAAALPEPVANNAVAALDDGAGGCTLVSATGIDATLAQAGIHARAWVWSVGDAGWTPLPDAPGPARIAASAVALRGRVVVLGGYSVASDGNETTHDTVAAWDPAAGWSSLAPLPVPIDDAVADVWRDRWIVVVSGWSNTRPVAAVQIYDADTDTWAMAASFPGTPVFGHAGAIAGDALLVVDGVASGGGGFTLVAQAWRATLDPARPTEPAWAPLPLHAGPARYRAAAGAVGGRIVITGGTDTPYNFDGLRYDTDQPALPLADGLAFDPDRDAFVAGPPAASVATMDHRGLVGCGDVRFTIGGIEAGPRATARVAALRAE